MLDFDKYVGRHGEFWVQAIIERLERYEGIRHNTPIPLEERWYTLMVSVPAQPRSAAA